MLGTEDDPGMIPRVIHTLFQNLVTSATEKSTVHAAGTHRVAFSYLEIYNEKVRQALVVIVGAYLIKYKVCLIIIMLGTQNKYHMYGVVPKRLTVLGFFMQCGV